MIKVAKVGLFTVVHFLLILCDVSLLFIFISSILFSLYCTRLDRIFLSLIIIENSAIANEFTIFKIFLNPNWTTPRKSEKSNNSLQINFNQRLQASGWELPWGALLFLPGMSMISNSIDQPHFG